ncbi:MAG: cellulase family glycosylhydrolase [Solirubrobacteraceae bacterium]
MTVPYAQPASGDAALLAAASAVHAHAVRTEVRWSEMEPVRGQRSAGLLGAVDAYVRAAAARNLKVILMVEGTPCWDSSAPPEIEARCAPGNTSEANRWPPASDAAYAGFVAFLAKRYASSLAAIEIWNEPDQSNEEYLAGPAKAAHYAAILKAAYPAIKAAAPGVAVLGGSFVGPNGVFLKLLYGDGIEGYYDGLSVHFYTLTIAALRAIHEVQLHYHDRKPLWLMEFGWSSCWPRQRIQQEQGCVSGKVQAQNLASMTDALTGTPYVAAEVFYKLQDSPGEQFGVLTAGGKRKPSFAAVARAFASPRAGSARCALQLAVRHGAVLARGSAPVGDFVVLEAVRNGRLRFRSLFILNRFNRFNIKLPRAVGTHGLTVSVYQYGRGLRGATVRRVR